MHGISSDSVVDQIASELAERRRQRHARRAAYLALATAIVQDEIGLLATFESGAESEAAAA